MRYFLAAALAVVMALPPANVGAGTVGTDAFLIIGASADLSDIEFIFCGDLAEPNVWLLVTTDAEANLDLVYIGSDAKVSAKGGVKMKQKAKSASGDIRLFDFPPPAPSRPRGPVPVETDVSASMSASYNPKTLSLDARVVDKTNGTTAELTSATEVYVIANLEVLAPGGCQALIDSVEESGALPQSVRRLLP